MSGKGILKNSNGTEYNGEFLNDKKHGKGIFSWEDGRKYAG